MNAITFTPDQMRMLETIAGLIGSPKPAPEPARNDTDLRLECVRIAADVIRSASGICDPSEVSGLARELHSFVTAGDVSDVIPCGTEDDDAFTLKCEGE